MPITPPGDRCSRSIQLSCELEQIVSIGLPTFLLLLLLLLLPALCTRARRRPKSSDEVAAEGSAGDLNPGDLDPDDILELSAAMSKELAIAKSAANLACQQQLKQRPGVGWRRRLVGNTSPSAAAKVTAKFTAKSFRRLATGGKPHPEVDLIDGRRSPYEHAQAWEARRAARKAACNEAADEIRRQLSPDRQPGTSRGAGAALDSVASVDLIGEIDMVLREMGSQPTAVRVPPYWPSEQQHASSEMKLCDAPHGRGRRRVRVGHRPPPDRSSGVPMAVLHSHRDRWDGAAASERKSRPPRHHSRASRSALPNANQIALEDALACLSAAARGAPTVSAAARGGPTEGGTDTERTATSASSSRETRTTGRTPRRGMCRPTSRWGDVTFNDDAHAAAEREELRMRAELEAEYARAHAGPIDALLRLRMATHTNARAAAMLSSTSSDQGEDDALRC